MDGRRKGKVYKYKYRNKETHKKEYEQQGVVHAKFTVTLRLLRVYHEWCNNKTEQIHGLIVNTFMLKRSYYCRTICGRARTYLGVSIDSRGFLQYYTQLYLEIGITMSSVTKSFYRQHDKRRMADQAYKKSPGRKKIRAKQPLENIHAEWKKEVLDKQKGNTYQSAMTAPTAAAMENDSNEKAGGKVGVARDITKLFCKACQNYEHQRGTSKLCHQNPKSKYYKGTCVQ
jgi:hypothetical protein